MDVERYRQKRAQLELEAKAYRQLCVACRQPDTVCYCSHIKAFDPTIKFVILIHPIEERRRIATGRMSHLCLKNSELIVGQDFTDNERVNEILDDVSLSPIILYPGRNSINLTTSTSISARPRLFKPGKTPVVFVVDGTWATARKMVRQSKNLTSLAKVCFTPPAPSRFRVRKQPHKECYSTIEAIHHTIELIGNDVGYSVYQREHDNLLEVFSVLVETQVRFLQMSFDNPKKNSYRRPKVRVV